MTDLPEGWRETRLGDLGRYLNGYAFNAKTWSTSGRPIIRIQNLTGSSNTFNYFEGEIADRYVVRNGDLLISWAATLGAFIWRGEEAVLNQHIFKVESHINLAFHRYLIDQKLDEMMRVTHGSGMVHITKGNFDNVPVALPPLAEQERIVEILEEQFSRLDSALASVKAVREKAKAFRRSLLHSAFSGELTGGTEGWCEVALGEVAKWGSGGTPKGKNPKFYGGDIPWAIIGDLNDGVISETAEKITQEGLDNSSAKWVPENSVLIAMYGSIGKLGINAIPLTTNQAIAFAVPDEALTLTKYLYLVLMNERQRLVKEGKGATQQNISQTILKPWLIPLPPLATQERIVEILEEQFSRLDNALEVANQLEARIASERRSLLHSAFTGALTATWRLNND